ncbi:MAG: phosphoglycerate mutase family protein [Firmicutes bacterium]|nr:phosphoglycerate mutase family protein [Bacillota bacterium]
MILAMVRHGQTYYNAAGIVQGRVNIPLNQTGKKQSRDLANIFTNQEIQFDLIASSPLSRALETAFIISKKMRYNQPIRVEHQFVERDFFHLDELPVGDAMPLVRQKNYKFDGYEDDQLLINRVVSAALKLADAYENKKVLLVTHSHVIKALRVYIDPKKYAFTDLVNNTDVIYFEIIDKQIRIVE